MLFKIITIAITIHLYILGAFGLSAYDFQLPSKWVYAKYSMPGTGNDDTCTFEIIDTFSNWNGGKAWVVKTSYLHPQSPADSIKYDTNFIGYLPFISIDLFQQLYYDSVQAIALDGKYYNCSAYHSFYASSSRPYSYTSSRTAAYFLDNVGLLYILNTEGTGMATQYSSTSYGLISFNDTTIDYNGIVNAYDLQTSTLHLKQHTQTQRNISSFRINLSGRVISQENTKRHALQITKTINSKSKSDLHINR